MIKKERFSHLVKALMSMPVVALIGSRQVGKITLALEVSQKIDKPVT